MKNNIFVSCSVFALVTSTLFLFFFDVNKTISNIEILQDNIDALTKNVEDFGIVCDRPQKYRGQCFDEGYILKFCGEATYYQCEFTGNSDDNCIPPCY